jgi:hypothetical protein
VVGMEFDIKIAVGLRDDRAGWQRANVTAFVVSGISGSRPELVGERRIVDRVVDKLRPHT